MSQLLSKAGFVLIELLGVAIDAAHGPWVFRGVCAHFERGELTFVISSDRAARVALLDVVSGRRVPTEGRAWGSGTPLMRGTADTVATFVGRVGFPQAIAEEPRVFCNLVPSD